MGSSLPDFPSRKGPGIQPANPAPHFLRRSGRAFVLSFLFFSIPHASQDAAF